MQWRHPDNWRKARCLSIMPTFLLVTWVSLSLRPTHSWSSREIGMAGLLRNGSVLTLLEYGCRYVLLDTYVGLLNSGFGLQAAQLGYEWRNNFV